MKIKIMTMKKLIGLLLLFAVVTSCDDKLNIEPFQQLDQAKAVSTEKDVLVTLIGAYDGLQSVNAYGGDMHTLSELTGNTEDIFFTGTFAGLSDAWKAEMAATNGDASNMWTRAYDVINRANNVLSGIDKITSSTSAKDRVEGEALFLRAAMHFEVVRLYAKTWDDGDNNTNAGVPILLQPTKTSSSADFRPRNTVAQVYQQVIDDLTRAELLLPASNSIYANKNSAAALLARVKLTQGVTGSTPTQLAALAEARNAADRVIASNRNPLAPSFASLWFTFLTNGGNSPAEYIFSMKVTNQDGVNALNTYFGIGVSSIPGTAGRGDCKITAAHRAKYAVGDTRNYFQQVGSNFYSRKHLDRFGNVPLVRTAEMFLTRAEANFRLGTAVGDTPLNDVNRIRNRAGLANLTSLNGIGDILNERYLELAFEGSRLHDIKRTRGSQSGLPWNSPKLVFPIPQVEIDTNKELRQNEGY
jgi:hypothetical protein